ncbi:MAG: DUF488 domain-containing protein [Chloroflexi bacterium]|nr:DUF488 domain-containing protein [Chloroflexota bacterium]
MTLEIATIGVYGFDEESFFQALIKAEVDTFCDIRARRGVRGSQYAFANSKRLQARLADMGIRYLHFPALAPSKELRQKQYTADKATRTAKRQRTVLDTTFIEAYRDEHLVDFDSTDFVSQFEDDVHIVAFCCVEREPAACHRSLLAERLQQDLQAPIIHLTPDET